MAFRIGKVEIPRRVLLAPMAGVTDSAFRRLCKRFGAGLVYTELVSSMGLVHRDERTFELVRFHPEERPAAVQIFGARPREMSEAARFVEEELQPDILDINLGCSVPKMGKSGGGAYLCRDLPLLREVLEAVRKAVTIPLAIKIRIGWDDSEPSAFKIARMAQEVGVDALAIHGRTSKQAYSGLADWETIRRVRESVAIPVIGSGDIASFEDAEIRLRESGCAAVMVGRATMGNPWVLGEIAAGLDGRPAPAAPGLDDRERMVLDHLDLVVAEKGDRGILEMRRHLAWYIKGLPHSAAWKQRFVHVSSLDEVQDLVRIYFGQLKEHEAEPSASHPEAA